MGKMHIPVRFLPGACAAAFYFSTCISLFAADTAGLITRTAWSYDRSELDWPAHLLKPGVKGWISSMEDQKTAGSILGASGWVEYDFTVARSGWFELMEIGGVPDWSRDLFLDGKLLFLLTYSHKEDIDVAPRKGEQGRWWKEANLYLKAGKHTLRFRRLGFPGALPSKWELRSADGEASGCIRATGIGHNVVRAGTRIRISVSGGTTVPTSYELVVRDENSKEITPCGTVEFPISAEPVSKEVEIEFPRQGVFQLLAKSGEKLSRPADLKAGMFIVIDTKNPPPPAAELKTTTVVDIDCVNQTINGQAVEKDGTFFEKDGGSRIVESPFGKYRESSGRGSHEYWATDGFSYKFNLPDADHQYRLRVEYPDDDQRSMGFWTCDGSDGRNGITLTGGVETGGHYALGNSMRIHEAFFYPLNKDGIVVAAINLVPGYKAAAARIRIDRVDSTLPAGPSGPASGRVMGFYFEEGQRWNRFFGAKAGEGSKGLVEHLSSLDRWGQWNRYLGANLMFPTVNVYQYNAYPSRILDGYFSEPYDMARMVALMAEKYNGKYVAEFHVSGQPWFDRHVMKVWTEEVEKNGRKEQVAHIEPEAEDYVIRDRDGAIGNKLAFNALHPRVQEVYLSVFGECADRLADCESFAGISTRLMLSWMWQGWNALPGLNWGYDDWTIAQFEKDTGIKVPPFAKATEGGAGKAKDPKRFRQRFDFLTGAARERWIEWRCDRIFKYHCRLRDRIRQAKPDAKLFLNYFGPDPREAYSQDMLGQMREIGMDYRRYSAEEGFVIVQGGSYGRGGSTPVYDARRLDCLYADDVKATALLGDRGFSLYTDYYEVCDNLDWEKLGGKKGYCAFDCCSPSGVNERELYAIAMADSDTSFFVNGGNGWMFGTPPVLSPFFREFRALPALKFTPLEKARDPVAVWTREVKKEEADRLKIEAGFYFYAVNRLPENVKVELSTANAAKVFPAAGGEPLALRNGQSLSFELEPFMLRSFRAEGNNVSIKNCSVDVPPELSKKLLPAMAFAKDLLDDLRYRRTAPELSEPDAREAMRLLNESLRAYGEGRIWRAKGNLGRPALVKVYDINGRYPGGLLDRKIPHGFTDMQDAPKLDFSGPQAIIGDVRGRLSSITDLAYDTEGSLWAASHGQVMMFDKDGNYLKCLSLNLEHKTDDGNLRLGNSLEKPEYLDVWSLRITPDKRVAAMSWNTRPALYETNTGRLLRLEWGYGFPVPGLRSSQLAIDKWGNTYLSCPEPDDLKGVYKFREDGTLAFDYSLDGAPSNKLSGTTASGGAVDAKGNIYLAQVDGIKVFSPSGKELESLAADEFRKLGKLAVFPDGSKMLASNSDGTAILCFERGPDAKFAKAWSFNLPARATALAISPDLGITIGFQQEINGAVAREYFILGNGLEMRRDLVLGTAAVQSSSLDGFTQIKTWNGWICYIAHKKIWKLAPGSVQAELLYDPKWPAHIASFEAFAIAPNGDIYMASHWNGKARGANVYRARKEKDGFAAMEYLNGGKPLHENASFVVTDMEMDGDDSLILRLHDPENNPYGRKVSIFRWTPVSGMRERLVEVGSAGANYGDYGLCRTADGGLIVAGGTTRSVVSISRKGDVLWRDSYNPHQGYGSTPFRQPAGATADSGGRIWLTEPARNNIVCLDSNGKFLKSYGKFGNLDDRGGMSFRQPAGIATIKDANGVEWLYVADIGNQRIARFIIK
ncbi:MAG: hypothetical protein WAX69_06270 [Victivallales bacterium]